MTLVLVDPEQQRKEYSLLTCQRVAISYLMDLYALYRGTNSPQMPPIPIKPVTMLQVAEIVDPRHWLDCIRWSRYQRQGGDASLEWFIARPTYAGFYYSLGEDGSLLLPRDSRIPTMTINAETVRTVAGQSATACAQPVIQVWDDDCQLK